MSYFTDCLKRFDELPADIKNRVGGLDVVNILQELEEQYNVPLYFLVILVTIGELQIKDVAEYLEKEHELSPDKAHVLKKELVEKIFSKFLDNFVSFQLLTNKGVKDILKGNINGLFQSDEDTKEAFNEKIKYEIALATEEEIKDYLSLLENNKEPITSGSLTFPGKHVDPTISNWIKAFVQFHGIEIFDNLVVTKFITTSENGKTLNERDRKKVRDILILYKNIKFFPDSLLEIPVEQWEFLPLYRKETIFTPKDTTPDVMEDVVAQPVEDKIPSIKKETHTYEPWTESAQYEERLQSIYKKHGFTASQRSILDEILESFLAGKFTIRELGVELQRGLTLNNEAVGLLLRDVYGLIIKPIGQYIPGYSNSLLTDLGVKADDYPDPENILIILNQIAIVKKQKVLADKIKQEHLEEEKEEKIKEAVVAQKVPELALELQEKLKEHYKKVQTESIKKAQSKFTLMFANEDEFTKQFYLAINERKIDEVIGALWVLAEKGKLLNILTEDKKIQKLYNKHLTNKYGDQVASDFEANPGAAVYLSYFLKHLLVDTMKMPSSDSAALVIHLLNEVKLATGQEVEMLAYGDMSSQEFVWRKIEKIENKLVFES